MLNLDLMQSRAGREIFQMGQIEGEQQGLIKGEQQGLLKGERLVITRLLERRFGKLPATLQTRLEQATLIELEQWSVELLTATCLEEIFKTQ
jgi:predicted transposase YdaD